ncbi:MAG: dTDP-4-dehydrorhamnose 3,5-epimerase [Robiginitomaculum sp.]|nr:dTDP-4-dehydrorhamnose 3,5-epimerase [Robiginitomaculum sp.]
MRDTPTRLNGKYTDIYNWQSSTDASLCVYYKKARGKKAKGVIQINHGLAEHAGRYARFAEALSKAGYHVYAHDHRGHGATKAPNASQGVFALENGSGKVLQDVKFVIGKIRNTHPDLPVIMFGHSMGAMITYNYLLRWPEDIDACAVWNAAMSKGGANGLLKFILGLEGKFKKPDAGSIINKLTFESFNKKAFQQATGIEVDFVQDNHSKSSRGVLRGLHYQIKQPQGKLVRVSSGEVFDVAVDLRKSSPSFGRWVGVTLSADNKRQLWIPPGFAHGFVVLSDTAEFLYKTTDYYAPEYERCIKWNDASLAIDWQYSEEPLVSEKDAKGKKFKDAETFDWSSTS